MQYNFNKCTWSQSPDSDNRFRDDHISVFTFHASLFPQVRVRAALKLVYSVISPTILLMLMAESQGALNSS